METTLFFPQILNLLQEKVQIQSPAVDIIVNNAKAIFASASTCLFHFSLLLDTAAKYQSVGYLEPTLSFVSRKDVI